MQAPRSRGIVRFNNSNPRLGVLGSASAAFSRPKET
nr:MAG TPA: hypothetical protein [Caudoviricetes sp.]